MAGGEMIDVEVSYARPDEQVVMPLRVETGTTVEEAVWKSGIIKIFPEIDLMRNKVGVFGKLTTLDRTLRAGDRVEIYRPLIADPKAVRRLRAAHDKKKSKKT